MKTFLSLLLTAQFASGIPSVNTDIPLELRVLSSPAGYIAGAKGVMVCPRDDDGDDDISCPDHEKIPIQQVQGLESYHLKETKYGLLLLLYTKKQCLQTPETRR